MHRTEHERTAKSRPVILAAVAVLLWTGCATTPPPVQLESGPDAEITHDGLVRVRWSRFQRAWIKPGADFARYTSVLMDPVSIAYKRAPNPSRSIAGSNDLERGNFELTEGQMQDLKRAFSDAFDQALQRLDHFERTDEPGPTTLRVEAAIVDLVVNVPTRQTSGRSAIATTSPAVMTLVLEVRDSETREILARVADRRDAGAGSGVANLQQSNASMNASALRLLFQRWARILADRLDQLRNAPPVQAPGAPLPATPEPPLEAADGD